MCIHTLYRYDLLYRTDVFLKRLVIFVFVKLTESVALMKGMKACYLSKAYERVGPRWKSRESLSSLPYTGTKNYKYLNRNFGEEDQKIAEKDILQLKT